MFISLSKERGVRARGYNLEVDYHLSILLPRGGRRETSRRPPHSLFLHTLMQNQEDANAEGKGPSGKAAEQAASQGFLSERGLSGFLGF